VLAGRRSDSTKRFSCDVLAKNSSYFPIGLILELRNRLEVVKDLWNGLHVADCSPFYLIRSSWLRCAISFVLEFTCRMHRAKDIVFETELLILYVTETSAHSDIVAVLSNSPVLVDFQSSNVSISKTSCLRTPEFRFGVEMVILDKQYAFLFRILHVTTVSHLLQVGVLLFSTFSDKTVRALPE
jgi:hypothetical protein